MSGFFSLSHATGDDLDGFGQDVILHDSSFCGFRGPNFLILLWMNIALGLDVRHIALYRYTMDRCYYAGHIF